MVYPQKNDSDAQSLPGFSIYFARKFFDAGVVRSQVFTGSDVWSTRKRCSPMEIWERRVFYPQKNDSDAQSLPGFSMYFARRFFDAGVVRAQVFISFAYVS